MTNPTDLNNLGERVSPVQAPPVVVAMVVHQPCPWLDEVLASLAAQDYPNMQTLFFVTGTASSPAVDIASAVNILPADNASDVIRQALPAAVIRQVEGNPG